MEVPARKGGSQLAIFADVPQPQPSSKDMGFAGSLIFGLVLIAVFIVGFGSWATLAPLESAAIASGEVIVEGNRRSVEHLEGGLIKKILVKDGSWVKAGQALILLEPTQATASMHLLEKRWHDNSALAARLSAEQIEAKGITSPPWLLQLAETNEAAAGMVETQRTIFSSRANTMNSQMSMLASRTEQFKEEIKGLEAEIGAIDQELIHIRAELKDVRTLVKRGLARRERLYALQRQEASILGRRGRNIASVARAHQSISENELRSQTIGIEARENSIRELRDVQAELADVGERLLAAEDIMSRTTITSPVNGVVVNLQVSTTGSVISPGESLMEIVPAGEELVIRARIDPIDIDVVRADLPARIRLTSLSARTTPELEAAVERVSADRLIDEATGMTYYEARIHLSDKELARLGGAELFPGMPVEVMISTGSTTLIDYLIQPITDLMRRGFTES
jgi:HlyD family secretion protein